MRRELARLGAKVMICGRTRSKLEDTVAALREEGLEAECVIADVTDETQVVAAVSSTVEWAGNAHGRGRQRRRWRHVGSIPSPRCD